MDILFANRKLWKICIDYRLMQKEYGQLRAKILRRRLDEFRAADNLSVLKQLPQIRCHELLHDRKGQLAVDLDHPYRLIFQPFDQSPPVDENGRLIWENVRAITILAIEDYHD